MGNMQFSNRLKGMYQDRFDKQMGITHEKTSSSVNNLIATRPVHKDLSRRLHTANHNN